MSRNWDVVVVGARVAGAATARLLAAAGLSVLCIDRSRRGSDTLSTHALMRGGVLLLHRWQLLDALRAAGTPPIRQTRFHYGADTIAVSIRPTGGVDALYGPRRTVLDPLLVEAASNAGVEFEFASRATGLALDNAGNTIGVVLENHRRRSTRVVRARLVVGADGRDSVVAAAAGAKPTAVGRHAGDYLYGYWSHLPTDGYEWFYGSDPGVAAGLIPTNDGLVCAFIGAAPATVRAEQRISPALSFHALAAHVGVADRLASATQVGPVRLVRKLPPGYLRQAHGPGWALVGDAGHWLDPISTHGMTAALRDADLLSVAVIADGPTAAGARYEAERNRLSLPMLDASDEIASYAWDLDRIQALLRDLSSAMADEVEAIARTARTQAPA